jgi:uncharacterized protein YcbX
MGSVSEAGSLLELWRYPVKSMGGESLESASVTERGIVGDRLWALRDEATGLVTDGKKIPKLMTCSARYLEQPGRGASDPVPPVAITLPGGSEVRSDESDAHQRLSAYCGRPVTLICRTTSASFFDVHTLHLLTTASVAALQAVTPTSTFSASRFRPNFLIDTGKGVGRVEQSWCGANGEIGTLRFQLQAPTERCSMVMRAHGNLPDDPAILRAVVEDGNFVGVYASVTRVGQLILGQALTLSPAD